MNAMRTTLMAATLLASACSSESSTTPADFHGDVVRHNMAVHILPLAPSPSMGAPTEIPGRRADVLMERYMTGKVKEPANGSAKTSSGEGGMPGMSGQ